MPKVPGSRGRYTEEFKRTVVAEAAVEGASVAAVARKHGLNDNMVFGWRRDPRFAPASQGSAALPQFIPVTLAHEEQASPVQPTSLEDARGRHLEIRFGEHVRVVCAEEISEAVLERLARVLGRCA